LTGANWYGVQKWANISNKHIGAAVDQWRTEGLAVSTIKEYLSGVRLIARHFGNDRIAPDNRAFNLENRVYSINQNLVLWARSEIIGSA